MSSTPSREPRSPTPENIRTFTVLQIKKILEENKVEFVPYRKKQYYVDLYLKEIAKVENVTANDSETPDKKSSTTPRSTRSSKSSTTTPRSTRASDKSKSSAKKSTPSLSSRRRKRKEPSPDETPSSPSAEPPTKKSKISQEANDQPKATSESNGSLTTMTTVEQVEVTEDSKKSSPTLRVATTAVSTEVNQLRASAHDATPMPKGNQQLRKSFATPKQIRPTHKKSATNQLSREATFVDPSLLSSSKLATQQNPESAESLSTEEVQQEEEQDSREEQGGNSFGFITRLLVVCTILVVSYLALFTFGLQPNDKPLFKSIDTPFCNSQGASDEKCIPCPAHSICRDGKIADCEPPYQYVHSIFSTQCQIQISGELPKVFEQVKAYLEKSEEKFASIDQLKTEIDNEKLFDEFLTFVKDGHWNSFSLQDSKVILNEPPSVNVLFSRLYQLARDYPGYAAGLCLCIFLCFALCGSSSNQDAMELRSLAIHHIKEDKSIQLSQLKEMLEEKYSNVYSEEAWDDIFTALKEDPRMNYNEDGQLFEWKAEASV